MSTRFNNGSHYENHPKAAELHDGAAHAHRVGEQHGKEEHLSGSEQSRQALEYSPGDHQRSHAATFGHADIAALAHQLWEARGCPHGSAEQDWFQAAHDLRARMEHAHR